MLHYLYTADFAAKFHTPRVVFGQWRQSLQWRSVLAVGIALLPASMACLVLPEHDCTYILMSGFGAWQPCQSINFIHAPVS